MLYCIKNNTEFVKDLENYIEEELESITERSLHRAELSSKLCRQSPLCPSCDTPQVYLCSFTEDSVEWKCRKCKTTFFNKHINGKIYEQE